MAVSRLARLAATAPVPVFPAVGAGARQAVEDLGLDPWVELVDSPRHATILLIAGRMPKTLVQPLSRVHDQMAHPRASLWWSDDAPPGRFAALGVERLARTSDPVAVARRLHAGLMAGERRSETDLLPDEPPNPWKGLGPHGQGGEGMMGGTPYGRPMAMTADDRDGLALDPLSFSLGPFLPFLPPGLTLDVVMQGDVLQSVAVCDNPFDGADSDNRSDPFSRALTEPVPIAELELARARHHLRHLARVLRLHGLPALALRALRASVELDLGDGAVVRRLGKRIRRLSALRWSTEGVGVIPREVTGALGGPNARAAGMSSDARSDDPAYGRLGFTPVTHTKTDAWARWQQRLGETTQSLELARHAGDAAATVSGRIESPYGTLDESGYEVDALGILPDVLTGMEIGDAVATLASLDIDLTARTHRPAQTVHP